MPDFDNINELINHAGGNAASMNTNFGDRSIFEIIKSEARRLETLIVDEIMLYKSMYKPKIYKRTGMWEHSVKVGEPVAKGNNIITIDITFEDALALHDSFNINGGEEGYVPWIMEIGINWGERKGLTPNRYSNWGNEVIIDRVSTGYLKRAVDRWMINNPYGMHVDILHNGNIYYSR